MHPDLLGVSLQLIFKEKAGFQFALTQVACNLPHYGKVNWNWKLECTCSVIVILGCFVASAPRLGFLFLTSRTSRCVAVTIVSPTVETGGG